MGSIVDPIHVLIFFCIIKVIWNLPVIIKWFYFNCVKNTTEKEEDFTQKQDVLEITEKLKKKQKKKKKK